MDVDLLLALIVDELGLIRDQIVDEARNEQRQLHVAFLLVLDFLNQPLVFGLDVRQLMDGCLLPLLVLGDAPL